MSWQPNTIRLITHGRYDEAVSGAICKPGQILARQSNGNVIPHNVSGGPAQPVMVAIEDALSGGVITTAYASGAIVRYYFPVSGDLFLGLIANGQNVTEGDYLMSNGDGTLIEFNASPGGEKLYEILAPSTTITNVGTETAFSNGSYVLPANFLAVGDVLRIHAKAFCIAVNAAATQRIRLYVGTTTLADSAAQALVANDVVVIDITMTIRTIGAGGTFIADGVVSYSIAGTFTEAPFTIVSTAIDTTVTETFVIKALASATNAGNQIRLDEMLVELDRAGLPTEYAVFQAADTLNNTTGSPAFLRVWAR